MGSGSSCVSYQLRDNKTINWRLVYIAANLREVYDTKIEDVPFVIQLG